MKGRVSLILLLAMALVLRGLLGVTPGLPLSAGEAAGVVSPAVHHDHVEAHAHHAPDSQVCQISCAEAVSPGLPVVASRIALTRPGLLTPPPAPLSLGEASAPDHPPPIA